MSRLTPLKAAEVIRKLHRLGFVGPVPGGRHMRMIRPQSGHIIPIPVHKGKDVSQGVIVEIIKLLQITREEWLDL